MLYILILVVCSAFIAFFLQLELRYFWLFPFLFIIIFFSQGFSALKFKFTEDELVEKYGLYALFLLVFFWLFWILNFIGLANQSAFFLLLFLCWILWYGSYFFEYNDGKKLFKHWFMFILFLLLGNSIFKSGRMVFWNMLWFISLLSLLGFWGLRYGVWTFKVVEKKYFHYFLFSLFFTIGVIIYLLFDTPLYALNMDLLFYLIIMLIFSIASYSSSEKENTDPAKEVSLRRVLAGEKILKKEKKKKSLFVLWFSLFKEMPLELKYLLEIVNVFLLIWILVAYLLPVFQLNPLQQWRYWSWIGLFLVNAFLLKKNLIFTVISRFAVVLIINFSLYISLLIMWDAVQTMLPWLIAWNVLCGVLVFYTRFPAIKQYIKKTDLMFWLLTTLVAMLLNIVLLMRLSISGQLIFSLIFFYIGIQGTIAYYAFQLIKNYNVSSVESQSWDKPLENKSNPLDALLDKEIEL